MNKYIDLEEQLLERLAPYSAQTALTANRILKSLDRLIEEHPDQVPGRTITRSGYRDTLNGAVKVSGYGDDWERGFNTGLAVSGTKVIPGPEPTLLPSMPGATVKMRKHHQWVRTVTGSWISTDGSILDEDGAQEIADEHGFEVIHDGVAADHDRAWWIENANVNDAEDCEACVGDLCPVHHGIALGIEFVTKKIAALGDDPELFNSIPNPPKAPGDDDE